MDIGHRFASSDDIDTISELYHPAIAEQAELREAWPIADALAEPVATTHRWSLGPSMALWSGFLSPPWRRCFRKLPGSRSGSFT